MAKRKSKKKKKKKSVDDFDDYEEEENERSSKAKKGKHRHRKKETFDEDTPDESTQLPYIVLGITVVVTIVCIVLLMGTSEVSSAAKASSQKGDGTASGENTDNAAGQSSSADGSDGDTGGGAEVPGEGGGGDGDGDGEAAGAGSAAGGEAGAAGGEESPAPAEPWGECSEECGLGERTRNNGGETETLACYLGPCTCSFVIVVKNAIWIIQDGGDSRPLFDINSVVSAYWEPVEDKIFSITSTGNILDSQAQLYALGKKLTVMTVDVAHKFIFAVGNQHGIVKATYGETKKSDWIVTGSNIKDVHTIVAHPEEKRIYWYSDGTKKIHRAGYEGEDAKVFGTSTKKIRGLLIDVAAKRLYWIELDGGRIYYSGLDTFKKDSNHGAAAGKPASMTPCRDDFYVADPGTNGGEVFRILKEGGSRLTYSDDKLPGISSIVAYAGSL